MIYRNRTALTLRFVQEVVSGEIRTMLSKESLLAAYSLKACLSNSQAYHHEEAQCYLAVLKHHFNSLIALNSNLEYACELFEEAVKLWNYWGKQDKVRRAIEAKLSELYGLVEEFSTGESSLSIKEEAFVRSFEVTYKLSLDLFASNNLSQIEIVQVYKALAESVARAKAACRNMQETVSEAQVWLPSAPEYYEMSIDDLL